MANRVEINEAVENAIGLNITGASVTVRFRGGVQAPVYDRQNGGLLLPQPLTTVNGKIGGDSPAGAWVAEAPYDLDVVFGSDTLTFSWNANTPSPIVTALPAGAGTSAPEDGETTIELYDSANGGAWLRRWRAAVSAWDMIGGPPPSGGVLPGTPRVRQEFYLTGGSPAVQHLRYNGATWDYVGTPPMVPVTGSPLTVLDVGQANQIRAGRQLALTDFSALLGLPTVPVGLFNLGSIANLGTGGVFTNKGAVTFGVGIEGVSNAAAQFTSNSAQALFIAGGAPSTAFSIKTGTMGAWIKTAKRGVTQTFLSKYTLASHGYGVSLSGANVALASISVDGAADLSVTGTTDIADNRWHHVVLVTDGTFLRLYVDGVQEGGNAAGGILFATVAPINVGGYGADGATVATNPHGGLVDEAFITADVLSVSQVRLLYASKIPHGYSVTPRLAAVGFRDRRRGAALATADFPSQPVRLYNFLAGALTDLGSAAQTLTANAAPLVVAGPDGAQDDGYNFLTASSQSLSSTDAGLPATTVSRSYGLWFKTSTVSVTSGLMGWGTVTTADARMSVLITSGFITSNSGADLITGPAVADGLWHFAVTTEENTPLDGVKRKLYVDGKMVGASAVLTSLTLAGANSFRIAASPSGTIPATAQTGAAFVFAGVLSPEAVAVIYQKSAQALGIRPDVATPYIRAFDATNVYADFSSIPTNTQVDLAVAG